MTLKEKFDVLKAGDVLLNLGSLKGNPEYYRGFNDAIDKALEIAEQAVAEERQRVKKALREGYENNFKWGEGGKYNTYITEEIFESIIKQALTDK